MIANSHLGSLQPSASDQIALSILVGVQFITMGLLGELIVYTYYEVQNKPTYMIRETLDYPTLPRLGDPALLPAIYRYQKISR